MHKQSRYVARIVPQGWTHPTNADNSPRTISHVDYVRAERIWLEGRIHWLAGEQRDAVAGLTFIPHDGERTSEGYERIAGRCPLPQDHLPTVPAGMEAFMIYSGRFSDEPVSPALETPFRTADWMTNNHVDTSPNPFGFQDWLELCMSARKLAQERARFDEETQDSHNQ